MPAPPRFTGINCIHFAGGNDCKCHPPVCFWCALLGGRGHGWQGTWVDRSWMHVAGEHGGQDGRPTCHQGHGWRGPWVARDMRGRGHGWQESWVAGDMGGRRHGWQETWVAGDMGGRRHGWQETWVKRDMGGR